MLNVAANISLHSSISRLNITVAAMLTFRVKTKQNGY